MNNKGFGLPEVLVFIGASMFILVVITIYCNNHNLFSNDERQDIVSDTTSVNNNTNKELVPNKQVVPSEYNTLEQKLKDNAYNYSFDKNQDTIITVAKLNINLIDPVDSDIKCNGYVIYKSNEKVYTPYINCPGMYVTEGYDYNLE